MKSKRLSEEQIIAVLKEAEAGAKTKELCRRHGVSEATFYNWRAKYAGMTVSEAPVERPREREPQAEAAVGRRGARHGRAEGTFGPKMVSPQARRAAVALLMQSCEFGVT